MRLSPITRRRFAAVPRQPARLWSLVIFAALFFVQPVRRADRQRPAAPGALRRRLLLPDLQVDYPETTFGGEFATQADYNDPEVAKLIDGKGWMLWPLIPYSYDTIVKDRGQPAPLAALWRHPLGTDDQARDVLARLIYSFRISVLFGFAADHPGLGRRHRRRRRAGLFRRPDRPALPALPRDLVEHAVALPADHHGELHRARTSGRCSASCCCSAGWGWSGWCAPSSCAGAISTMCGRRGPWACWTRASCSGTSCPTP